MAQGGSAQQRSIEDLVKAMDETAANLRAALKAKATPEVITAWTVLLQHAVAKLDRAQGTKPLDTSSLIKLLNKSEPKTIEVISPGVLYADDDDLIHTIVTFDGEESFKEYLMCEQWGGLTPVIKQEARLLVNQFAQLVPGGIYAHVMISNAGFAEVLEKARQLQQSRENESARALADPTQHAEPDQAYELQEDKTIAAQDVVVTGAKPVKEIANRCEELARLPMEPPAAMKPASMVGPPEPGAEHRGPKACTNLQVVRLQRSQVMNRVGAAGRLLRF